MCDLDSDGQISVAELTSCAHFPPSKGNIAEEVFRVFDQDHNDFLSKQEYVDFVSMSFENTVKGADEDEERGEREEVEDTDEEVEVIDRHGKKKIMKKSAFDQMNQEKMKGLSLEEGEMTKVEEGETTLERAREENPELARVLALGKWIQSQLAERGHATGKMVNMKTLDSRDDGAQGQQKLQGGQDFEVRGCVLLKWRAELHDGKSELTSSVLHPSYAYPTCRTP